jgi:hypothetical protein
VERRDGTDGGNGDRVPNEERSNLEVGMQLVSRTLPCVLVLVMEGWADWLLVLPQFKAKIYVFCDGLPEESRQVFEECGLGAGPWLPVTRFWDHEVLKEDSLCVLVSGSLDFVEDCVSRVPDGINVVAASGQCGLAVPRGGNDSDGGH